tara:strand:- start:6760 stop:7887 length:1128 start_codon:yes stop_codon:yes gene_type:complete
MIKFWSYQREYKKYKINIISSIKKSLSKGNIFFGNELKTLEKSFVKKYKSKYGIAVGSGTDALLISLKALDIKKNDEIITAANTAIPTIAAIINSGAKPILVDIDEDYLIDCNKIEKVISPKTKAIIPVHLYGQACNMDKLTKIGRKYKIEIIEDCAQAQGAKFKNKFVGTFGKFGCFSFYPTKILGAYGDGGFILTNDFNYYKKIKRIRFYGIETVDKKNKFKDEYYSNENGLNSRLDEIQAGILNFKLKYVEKFIKRRIYLAKIYLKELQNTSLKLPYNRKFSKHVYHLFTVYHPRKNQIVNKLYKKKIQTRVIYPYPIHKMKAYKKLKFDRKKLLKSEIKSKGIFSLPLYPELKKSEVLKICKIVKEILEKV